MPKITVVFFHLSFEQSSGGVERYGKILEAEAGTQYTPVSVHLSIRAGENPAIPSHCGGLPMIFQLSPKHHASETMEIVGRALRANPGSRAIIIVHDANLWISTPGSILRSGLWKKPKAAIDALRRWRVAPRALTRPIFERDRTSFSVFSTGQKYKLPSEVRKRTHSVPHFVESPKYAPDRHQCRARIGLEGKTVLAILGYVNPRKNPELALRALAKLPTRYVLVLAGGPLPRMPNYPGELNRLARELGVENRFFQTGYLPDEQQAEYIAATDIGLCLFQSVSASGSLSTWFSYGVPVLASKLEEFALYDSIAPNALLALDSNEPDAVAAKIASLSHTQLEGAGRSAEHLRKELSVEKILGQLLRIADSPGR